MFYNRKRGIVRVIRCYRQNMKINIINYSEVSKLDMALHFSIIQYGDLYYLTTIQSNFYFKTRDKGCFSAGHEIILCKGISLKTGGVFDFLLIIHIASLWKFIYNADMNNKNILNSVRGKL